MPLSGQQCKGHRDHPRGEDSTHLAQHTEAGSEQQSREVSARAEGGRLLGPAGWQGKGFLPLPSLSAEGSGQPLLLWVRFKGEGTENQELAETGRAEGMRGQITGRRQDS